MKTAVTIPIHQSTRVITIERRGWVSRSNRFATVDDIYGELQREKPPSAPQCPTSHVRWLQTNIITVQKRTHSLRPFNGQLGRTIGDG